jgi:CheY-like chemotaxis protein
MQNKGKILIVDDDGYVHKMLEALLFREGYDLEFAFNGRDGFQKAKEIKPTIVLSDVMMPVMTGFELCSTLRNDPETADIPVLLITALDDIDSRIQGFEAGADDFVTKPFDHRELVSRVKTIIRMRHTKRLIKDRNGVEKTDQTFVAPDSLNDLKTLTFCIKENLLYSACRLNTQLGKSIIAFRPDYTDSASFIHLVNKGNSLYLLLGDLNSSAVSERLKSVHIITIFSELIENDYSSPSSIFKEMISRSVSDYQPLDNKSALTFSNFLVAKYDKEMTSLTFSGQTAHIAVVKDLALIKCGSDDDFLPSAPGEDYHIEDNYVQLYTGSNLFLFSGNYVDFCGKGKDSEILIATSKMPLEGQKEKFETINIENANTKELLLCNIFSLKI